METTPTGPKTSIEARGSAYVSVFLLGVELASNTRRSRPRRIRHRRETDCELEAEKEALSIRLQRMRELLSTDGSRLMDNGTLLHAMFDIVEREVVGVATEATEATEAKGSIVSRSMMRNSGKACR